MRRVTMGSFYSKQIAIANIVMASNILKYSGVSVNVSDTSVNVSENGDRTVARGFFAIVQRI